MNAIGSLSGGSAFDGARGVSRTQQSSNDSGSLGAGNLFTLDFMRNLARNAVTALLGAHESISARTTFAAPSVKTVRIPGLPGSASGYAPAGAGGIPSVLLATRGVNEQTTTVRSSTGALLLDTTSPEQRTVLTATGEVNAQTSTERSSDAALGLDVATEEAASTLTSTAEANTAGSSYDAIRLEFSGATSLANLSGIYVGAGAASSATSLRIKTLNNVTLDTTTARAVQFQVLDQANNVLFNFNNSIKAGDVVNLGSDLGLSVTFSEGTLKSGRTSSASNVSNNTPTDVNAAAAFNNADVNLRPRFESGAQVVAGSFQVNDTTVNVLAGDSINSVIARINSTVSGVVASFSADKLTLTTAGNSEETISIGNDTSGFLSALKIAGASTTVGNVRDDLETFAQSLRLGAVVSGSFEVNGTSISVDRDTDTLQSVLARVNAANLGVTASYDAEANLVRFTPNTPGASLVLRNDTSGFLSAVDVAEGATGTQANPDNPFNGTGASSPLFEAGVAVASGTFTINGVSINVAVNDSINSVLAKINASSAGVVATLSDDRVSLETAENSEQGITLGADSSGFLAAVKLSGAVAVTGRVRDDADTFAQSTKLGSVDSGGFEVNGVYIAIDRSVDSLSSVLARINTSGAGVSASYDAATDKVVFTPDTAGATLSLENDTSGFLSAIQVNAGTVGTRVDPEAAFNATGQDSPGFDPGQAVTAGSFTVNGVTIGVAANDTVNGLLAKITASSAGVTATLDPTTQRVRLATDAGSEDAIVVADDTSGFLAAVKLDGTAQSSVGTTTSAPPLDVFVSQVLPTVSDGTLTINGQSVFVTPGTQSLREIFENIDALSGVSAQVDSTTGRVSISAGLPGETLVLSDTSGLLSALGVPSGTLAGRAARTQSVSSPGGEVLENPGDAARQVGSAIDRLNEALTALDSGPAEALQFKKDLVAALHGALQGLPTEVAGAFKVSETADSARLTVDTDQLTDALRRDPRVLQDFLRHGLGEAVAGAVEASVQAEAASKAQAVAPASANPLVVPMPAPELVRAKRTASMYEALLPALEIADKPSAFALSRAKAAYGMGAKPSGLQEALEGPGYMSAAAKKAYGIESKPEPFGATKPSSAAFASSRPAKAWWAQTPESSMQLSFA